MKEDVLFPFNFDNNYRYALIKTAISYIKKNGQIIIVFYLKEHCEDWKASDYPFTCMMKGQMKPVIQKH